MLHGWSMKQCSRHVEVDTPKFDSVWFSLIPFESFHVLIDQAREQAREDGAVQRRRIRCGKGESAPTLRNLMSHHTFLGQEVDSLLHTTRCDRDHRSCLFGPLNCNCNLYNCLMNSYGDWDWPCSVWSEQNGSDKCMVADFFSYIVNQTLDMGKCFAKGWWIDWIHG
jgi:hypothetical protein